MIIKLTQDQYKREEARRVRFARIIRLAQANGVRPLVLKRLLDG